MPPLPRVLCFTGLLLSPACLRAVIIDPDGASVSAYYPSAAMVNGRPAVAWKQSEITAIKYVRANDTDGNTWGPPFTIYPGVDGEDTLDDHVSLRVVNGSPAVCFTDSITGTLLFARAADADGSVWNAPVSVASVTAEAPRAVLEIVDGNPAICYCGTAKELTFVRATNVAGTSWGAPVVVDAAGVFFSSSLKVVEGLPAIAYGGTGGMKYVRAANAGGTAWTPPVTVVPLPGDHRSLGPSMEIVNGRPAIGFRYDYEPGDLAYVRASDATGAAWGAPAIVDTDQDTGYHATLAVINGKPALGYFADENAYDVRYLEALDSDGAAGSWNAAVTVDSPGVVGRQTRLFEVNGRPALVYHDVFQGRLKYTRAVSTSGPLKQWPAELFVHSLDDGSQLFHNRVKSFGSVPVNSAKTIDFALQNPNFGSIDLTIATWTLTGPDAAAFSFTPQPVATTLAATQSTVVKVTYAPVTPGTKSAVLRITSNAATDPVYDVILQGESVPDIRILAPGGAERFDNTTLYFPVIPPGSVSDTAYSITNPGGASLDGLTFTFDGPDAADFFIAAPPAIPLAPLAASTFTVRHKPVTAGAKTATLHIGSNITGEKNPFDLTFKTVTGLPDAPFASSTGTITSVALQTDGRILAGGDNSLQRFNPNGTKDALFFDPPVSGGQVDCIAVQKDGRILLGGFFTRVGGQDRPGLARLLPDGSLDTAFAPGAMAGVSCLALQPDGGILAGGNLTSSNGTNLRLLRLRADGTQDASFVPVPDGSVWCLALQPDGKIIAGGQFQNISGLPAPNLARLTTGGEIQPFTVKPGIVKCLTVLPDGRILAGGSFEKGLARFHPDGTVDPTLTVPFDNPNQFALQADGKCLAALSFPGGGGATPSRGVVCFFPDGSQDPGFNPPGTSLTSTIVQRITHQPDGKLLITKFLPPFPPVTGNFSRLLNDFAPAVLKNEGPSTVRWMRGGAAPEVWDVTFDVKPDNSPGWTRLGNGTRISGGWELTGLTLPASGTLRAQGYVMGHRNVSVMENVTPILTPLQSWRLQYFNTSANTGDAADDADPDKDGLTNFTEFAFGLSPVDGARNALPEFIYTNNSITATFTAPEGREDVIYGAEWSPDMQPGTWSALPDTGLAGGHEFKVSGGGGRVLVRYVVRTR